MEGLIMAGQLILALSILVIIHELGHFLAARAFGIKVEKFYLFFDVGGVKLFKYKYKDVEYGIGWLPLGGYVKITGMIDESMDKEAAQRDPEPYEFRAKPAWQRLIVMLGGIIMNVILGIIIFTLHTWYYGETYVPATELKNGVVAGKLAEQAGFQTGDVILKMNGQELKRANEIISPSVFLDKGVTYTVSRNGEEKTIQLDDKFGKKLVNAGADSFIQLRNRFIIAKPVANMPAEKAGIKPGDSVISVNNNNIVYFNEFSSALAENKNKTVNITVKHKENNKIETIPVNVDSLGKVGIEARNISDIDTTTYNFSESVGRGPKKALDAIVINAKGIWRLVTGDMPANKSLHGVIGIANAFGGDWEWISFWALTGMLSMVLAIMN
ncbi:MAG: RIP metalloprotease RseP, partial [Sphingobacteriales bacterium]